MTELKFQRATIGRLTAAYKDTLKDRDVGFALRWYDELQDAWKELQRLERVASRLHVIRPESAALEDFLSADIDALYQVHLARLLAADSKTLEDLAAFPKPPK